MTNNSFILQKYRASIAYIMSIWFVMLVISGSIFTHKEVTSTGEIVVHNHPYDFTKKNEGKSHHHSDEEIHFLDVVFCSTYTPAEFISYEPILRPVFQQQYYYSHTGPSFSTERSVNHLRGPPMSC